MLGRLRMGVDECISAYCELMEMVSEKQSSRFPCQLDRWHPVTVRFGDAAECDRGGAFLVVEPPTQTSCFDPEADKNDEDEGSRGCRV